MPKEQRDSKNFFYFDLRGGYPPHNPGARYRSTLMLPSLHTWCRRPIRKTLKESREITEKIQKTEESMCIKWQFDLCALAHREKSPPSCQNRRGLIRTTGGTGQRPIPPSWKTFYSHSRSNSASFPASRSNVIVRSQPCSRLPIPNKQSEKSALPF